MVFLVLVDFLVAVEGVLAEADFLPALKLIFIRRQAAWEVRT